MWKGIKVDCTVDDVVDFRWHDAMGRRHRAILYPMPSLADAMPNAHAANGVSADRARDLELRDVVMVGHMAQLVHT